MHAAVERTITVVEAQVVSDTENTGQQELIGQQQLQLKRKRKDDTIGK